VVTLSHSGSESENSSLDEPGSTRHDDRDYLPQLQGSRKSRPDATSPRNIEYKEMPNEKTRNNVLGASPAGGRCVITLTKIGQPQKGIYARDIAYCHAMARELGLSMVSPSVCLLHGYISFPFF
jgi:hypothetical protein